MKFYINTLGCKVNTYESNVIRDIFLNAGYKEETLEKADIIVVNTCSVTNKADSKSLKTVRQARRKNKDAIIIVSGCSSQNKQKEYLDLEDVDIVLGNRYKTDIIKYIEEYKQKKEKINALTDMKKVPFEIMMLNNFNQTRAFVKIQDGCNNFCSYCIIPYVRGNVRSKNKEDVIKEVKKLVEEDKKEIVLTGIHTGNYGKDLKTSLADLLEELVKVENLERIRISSIEITELDEHFMKVLKENEKIVDHMHIPLQSGANKTLKDMNRKYDKDYFIKKIEEIRKIRPNINITTDVIVGFPNETEEDFNETIETIKKVKFTKIHVFPYSKREGTKAALMDNQIKEAIKQQRVHKLLEISEQLEKEYMEKYIGKTVEILPEKVKENILTGHTGNYLQVKTKGKKEDINKLIKVKIKSLNYPYLEGEKLTSEQ